MFVEASVETLFVAVFVPFAVAGLCGSGIAAGGIIGVGDAVAGVWIGCPHPVQNVAFGRNGLPQWLQNRGWGEDGWGAVMMETS